MAEIAEQDSGKKGGRQKVKPPPHIDMTPMVDLMCLLIVFFMLTAAFTKAKIMEINLPEKIRDPNVEPPKIPESRTVNIILGPDDRVFTYPGMVREEDYGNPPPLRETTFGADGIRRLLVERNITLAKRIYEFNNEILTGRISLPRDSIESEIRKLKRDDDTGPIVLIKAYKSANYGNFVEILDEMNIVGIARYSFVDLSWIENFMVERALGIASTASASTGN